MKSDEVVAIRRSDSSHSAQHITVKQVPKYVTAEFLKKLAQVLQGIIARLQEPQEPMPTTHTYADWSEPVGERAGMEAFAQGLREMSQVPLVADPSYGSPSGGAGEEFTFLRY